ncbi:MAG: toxin [Bacteroidales bacterium]|nr:toxin [Bacteroidales bacterium]MEA4839744.1 toxin [Bacteroidales bacterium]
MADRHEVESFLNELKTKINIFGIVYLDDRKKNAQTLFSLEISPIRRTEFIQELKAKDYSSGPIDEKMRGFSDMWVFGITVKSVEVYVKICLGLTNISAVCISFHIAEHPLNYPLKK